MTSPLRHGSRPALDHFWLEDHQLVRRSLFAYLPGCVEAKSPNTKATGTSQRDSCLVDGSHNGAAVSMGGSIGLRRRYLGTRVVGVGMRSVVRLYPGPIVEEVRRS
jgi:hypothetical protein